MKFKLIGVFIIGSVLQTAAWAEDGIPDSQGEQERIRQIVEERGGTELQGGDQYYTKPKHQLQSPSIYIVIPSRRETIRYDEADQSGQAQPRPRQGLTFGDMSRKLIKKGKQSFQLKQRPTDLVENAPVTLNFGRKPSVPTRNQPLLPLP